MRSSDSGPHESRHIAVLTVGALAAIVIVILCISAVSLGRRPVHVPIIEDATLVDDARPVRISAAPQKTPIPNVPTTVLFPDDIASLTNVDFSQPLRYAYGVNITVSRPRLTPDNSLNGSLAVVTATWLTAATSPATIGFRFWGDRLYDEIWEAYKKKTLNQFNATAAANTIPFYHCWPAADQVGSKCRTTSSTAANTLVGSNFCTVSAGRATCRFHIRAPTTRTGQFHLALRVVDVNFADPNYPLVVQHGLNDVAYAPVEATCSDGIYCNGQEYLVGLKCQVPNSADIVNKPCFAGTGDCYEYRCREENGGTCDYRPLFNNVTLTSDFAVVQECAEICDVSHCNPLCKRAWECGSDGCKQGCYTALDENQTSFTYVPVAGYQYPAYLNNATDPQYYDGKCTGVKRNGDYTSCVENTCGTAAILPGSCAIPLRLTDLEAIDTYAGLDTRTGADAPTRNPLASNRISPLGFQGLFRLNTNQGTQQVKPECGAPGVRDLIVQLEMPPTFRNSVPMTGFEIRAYGDPDSPGADTLLEIRESCEVAFTYPTGACSDDAAPPGGVGSRLFGRLEGGKNYTLVVSGYGDGTLGSVLLEVWFSGEDCSPQCEGKSCGSDGCTITRGCGNCAATACCYACGDDPICRYGQSFCTEGTRFDEAVGHVGVNATCDTSLGFTCIPDCRGRTCGPSANRCPDASGAIIMCGRYNGTCKDGEGKACDVASGQCVPVKRCDGMAPDCGPRTGRLRNSKTAYCASDCVWHDMREEIIDLVINNISLVMPSLQLVWTSVSPESPALAEGCINSPGIRALLRFDTWVLNMGSAGYYPATPTERPDIYEYSFVHGHPHFLGFARFDLYRERSLEPIVLGGKLAYCMENTLQFLKGPRVGCTSDTTCDNQGIDIGGGDLYSAVLDCQWLDVTDLLCGPGTGIACVSTFVQSYNGRVGTARTVDYLAEANFDRSFPELTFDNNRVQFPIYLPTLKDIQLAYNSSVGPVVGTSFSYCAFLCGRSPFNVAINYPHRSAVLNHLAYPSSVYGACGC